MEFIGVQLVEVLASHDKDLLLQNPDIVQQLYLTWTRETFAHRFSYSASVEASRLSEPNKLINCFIYYAKAKSGDIGPILQLLSAFANRDLSYIAPVRQYLFEIVPKLSVLERQALMTSAISRIQERDLADLYKSLMIDKVLIPMIIRASLQTGDLDLSLSCGDLKQSVVPIILNWLIRPNEYDDRLKLSYLQLVSVFLKYSKNNEPLRMTLESSASQLMHFAWDFAITGRNGWINDELPFCQQRL